jgi:triacylglycerol esterase/lipase EstA (alpha/beta hydrolase family)
LITTVALGALAMVKILNSFASLLPAPLKRAVYWLHSMAFEAIAVTAFFLMRPLGIVGWSVGKCGPEEGRPILLIHGYIQNASNWVYLKRKLCQKGFGPVFTLNLGHPFRSIREHAETIAKKAALIAKETGREDLTLIGHSMGGLASAWYAAKLARPGKVGDVITIGSPLRGTKMAQIAIGKNGREMERGSDFVREVEEIVRKNRKVRFYHIASKADQIVLPYSSAFTGQHPEREYILDDIGHMSLLYSKRVADKIENWLSSARRC